MIHMYKAQKGIHGFKVKPTENLISVEQLLPVKRNGSDLAVTAKQKRKTN